MVTSPIAWSARAPRASNSTPGDLLWLPRPLPGWHPVADALYKFVWSSVGGPLANAAPALVGVSVAIHVATSLALCVAGCALYNDLRAALIASLLFAVHPLAADTVRGS